MRRECFAVILYGIIGVILFAAIQAIAVHQVPEAVFRPLRTAIAGDTGIGDSLPRSRPSFATWSTVSILAATLTFSLAGAFVAAGIDDVGDEPVIAVAVAVGLTLVFAAPLTVVAISAPSFRPIRDPRRVPSGSPQVITPNGCLWCRTTTSTRWPGRSTACRRAWLNAKGCMQRSGPTSTRTRRTPPRPRRRPIPRRRGRRHRVLRRHPQLHHPRRARHRIRGRGTSQLAVGHHRADPSRPSRARQQVPRRRRTRRLRVPEALTDHADHAVAAAQEIQQRVRKTFGPDLRIGIGINTGNVIAGTIGGGGKLEFTLIGDPVNVAARVEQLTKETGDSILLTQATVDALHTQRQLEAEPTLCADETPRSTSTPLTPVTDPDEPRRHAANRTDPELSQMPKLVRRSWAPSVAGSTIGRVRNVRQVVGSTLFGLQLMLISVKCVKAVVVAIASWALVACGTAEAPDPQPTAPTTEPTKATEPAQESDMKIEIRIGDQRFRATLDDSAAARDLIDQLPVTVNMSDHGGVEKTGRLPSEPPSTANLTAPTPTSVTSATTPRATTSSCTTAISRTTRALSFWATWRAMPPSGSRKWMEPSPRPSQPSPTDETRQRAGVRTELTCRDYVGLCRRAIGSCACGQRPGSLGERK